MKKVTAEISAQDGSRWWREGFNCDLETAFHLLKVLEAQGVKAVVIISVEEQ